MLLCSGLAGPLSTILSCRCLVPAPRVRVYLPAAATAGLLRCDSVALPNVWFSGCLQRKAAKVGVLVISCPRTWLEVKGVGWLMCCKGWVRCWQAGYMVCSLWQPAGIIVFVACARGIATVGVVVSVLAAGTIRHQSRRAVCQSGLVWLCTSQQPHLEVAAALKACSVLITRRMAGRGAQVSLQHAGL